MIFELSEKKTHPSHTQKIVFNKQAGAYVSFEGWIRELNKNKKVTHIVYEAYEAIACKEVKKIFSELNKQFPIIKISNLS